MQFGSGVDRRKYRLAKRLAVLALIALAVAAPAAAGCDDDERPAAPHSLKAVPLGSGGITLQWSSNAGHYDIYIRDKQGRACPEAPDIVGGATNENYHDFYGLKPDKEYFFSIRARTEGGTEGCVSKNASETVSARTDTADTQDFCHRYTNDVMAQIKQMNDKQCQMPGNIFSGVWARSENAHFLACIAQKRARKSGLDTAQWARNQDLQACKEHADKCHAYNGSAIAAAIRNRRWGCGYTGGRWDLDGSHHYSWCMSQSADSFLPTKETQARKHLLIICAAKKAQAAQAGGGSGGGGGGAGTGGSGAACPGVPHDWTDMLAAHNELRGQYCGAPLTWSCDLAKDAQTFAEDCKCGHSNAPGVGENLAATSVVPDKFPATEDRKAFDDTWKCEEKLFDFTKPVIVGGFKTNCLGPPDGTGVNGHFTQVVWKSNKELGCGIAKCPIKDDKCQDVKDKNGNVLFETHWVCRYRGFDDKGNSIGGNNDGLLTQNVQKPPACTTQKFHSRSISCSRGMVPTDDGRCACPPGRRWNGRTCAPRRIISTPTPPPSGPDTCPRDRPIGTPPNCCPEGTTFDGSVCRTPTRTTPSPECTGDRPVGTYPNCCPRGTFFSDGKCRTGGGGTNGTQPGGDTGGQPRCTGDRPVGTYPNCCPTGTFFSDGKCRTGGGGTNGTQPGGDTGGQPRCTGDRPVGTYPNCCPRGTFFSDGKCRTGGGGTNGTQPGGGTGGRPGCTGDRPIGTPPNCCPRGTSFQNGKCIRPTTTTNPSGNGGTSGTKTCPPGTHATRSGQCEPDASPTTPMSKGRCTGGRVGTPPRCFCPGGRRFIGGRCRSIPKTAPAPTGPAPKKQCSGGKVPRSGDGACVCPSGTADRGGQCVGVVK